MWQLRLRLWWARWLENRTINCVRLVPRAVRKWVIVLAYAKATTGEYGNTHPEAVTYPMLMKRNGW